MFFSIPYDEGWTATVNGKEAEIIKANVGFMAVKVEKGVSEIKFNYQTPYLLDGIKISTVSALVLIIYIIAFSIYNRRKNTNIDYPEGDELLRNWRIQEINLMSITTQVPEVEPPKSLLDNMSQIEESPKTKYDGGFKIETDIFDEKE